MELFSDFVVERVLRPGCMFEFLIASGKRRKSASEGRLIVMGIERVLSRQHESVSIAALQCGDEIVLLLTPSVRGIASMLPRYQSSIVELRCVRRINGFHGKLFSHLGV